MRVFALLFLAAFLLSLPARAQLEAGEAEERIREACHAESGTESAKCDCYISRLREGVPEETYAPMMTLAAAAISGDTELMLDFIAEARLDPETFNRMLEEMEAAVDRAEASCGR